VDEAHPLRGLIAIALAAAACARPAPHLSSYIDGRDMYERMVAGARPFSPSLRNARGGIVSHHLLAGREIAGFFRAAGALVRPGKGTIVIIGPNHASRGTALVAASARPWKTPLGTCGPDTALIRALGRAGAVTVDEDAFYGEHAIGALVPFIAYYFPSKRVVPIVLNFRMTWEGASRLGTELARHCGAGDMVILSADFVHGRSAAEAKTSDARSRIVLEKCASGCGGDASVVEVDCRKGLVALCAYLRETGGGAADILLNTNGGELTGTKLPVTSYFFVLYGSR
jgi:AmmeMemoRadiSam system protein B